MVEALCLFIKSRTFTYTIKVNDGKVMLDAVFQIGFVSESALDAFAFPQYFVSFLSRITHIIQVIMPINFKKPE